MTIPLRDEKGLAIIVPPGPLDADLKARIEKAVTKIVPPGKRFAVVGLYDIGGKALDVQVATRLGQGFEFTTNARWDDDKVTGFVGVNWSF